MKDIERVVASARRATGNVAVHASWTGDPGRSPLSTLIVAAEPAPVAGDDGESDGRQPREPSLAAGHPPPPTQPGRPDPCGRPGAACSLLDDAKVIAALASAFGPGGVGVVAHDAKELMRSLLPIGVDMVSLAMDTAVAAYLLDPSVDHYRLADLAAAHLGVELDGGTGGEGQGAFVLDTPDETDGADDTADAGGIGAGPDGKGIDAEAVRQALVLARLRAPLRAALEAVGEYDLMTGSSSPWSGCWPAWRWSASRSTEKVLRSIAAELAEECRTLEGTLHELAEGPFNVNSVPQLRAVLYDRLGLTPVRKTKTGFSTDARTLELLRDQHPIVDALLRYREVEKLRSTYGESLAAEVAPDGRIHATFRQTVARTGRLSSDRPNLHNIPVRTEQGRQFRARLRPLGRAAVAGGRLRPGRVAGHRSPLG